jgi:hypothetical protein
LIGATSASVASLIQKASGSALAAARSEQNSFRPGETWVDTDGKPIQAHGGSIIFVGAEFYWYGENKEFTTGKTDVWTWGVRCYSSQDLYNWKDLGLIIPPDTNNPRSPLSPTQPLDRPHIIYNAATKKFVCWIKLLSSEGFQTRSVLTADQITGPYSLVGSNIKPLGMSAGDYDITLNVTDGKGYMYFERVHSETICADLTDDYTGFIGYYSTHFPHTGPPFVREGLAHFSRKGKHYLASSGTTGYFPNVSEIAVADTFHGPFSVIGDLHPSDRSRTSFNSQISCVFRHPHKKDLYIAMADRWMGPLSGPDFEEGAYSKEIGELFARAFASGRAIAPADRKRLEDNLHINTSLSRYVWLPIRFDEERPSIEWRYEWKVEDFD